MSLITLFFFFLHRLHPYEWLSALSFASNVTLKLNFSSKTVRIFLQFPSLSS